MATNEHTRQLVLLLAAVFAFISIQFRFNAMHSDAGMDFFHFWAVPVAVEQGKASSIYTEDGRAALGSEFQRIAAGNPNDMFAKAARQWPVWDTTATPALYCIASPLRALPYDQSLAIFRYASVFAGLAAIYLLVCRVHGLPIVAALLLAGFLYQYSNALVSDLRVGNINHFQLLAIAVAAWLCREGRWPLILQAGLLGAAIAIKPNLHGIAIALGLLYLVRGEYRRLATWIAASSAGFGIMVIAGSVYLGGIGYWMQWLGTLRRVMASGYPTASGNVSLTQTIVEWGGPDLSIAAVFCIFAALGAMFWMRRRDGEPMRSCELVAIAIGATYPLLAYRLAWSHYYVLAIPLIVAALGVKGTSIGQRVVIAASLALYVSWPQAAAFLRGFGGNGPWAFANAGAVGGLLVGVALGRREAPARGASEA